ncbi:MAG TPA: TIGR04086 family membrane protein [Ruminiclostridium sp.]|nr:TIGR04086 family membrane protein [Ruminiclostridium sp.]
MKADMTASTERLNMSRAASTVLTGLIAGLVTSIVFLLIFSFVMTVRDIPEGVVPTLSAISLALGSIMGGFVSAKLLGKAGLVSGAVVGAVLFLIMMLAGTAIQGGNIGVSAADRLVAWLTANRLSSCN